MAWLLDTNVLSELRRPRPEPKVVAFISGQPLDQLYISAVTLAEIRFGIELVTDPNRRGALNDWLAQKVRPMFDQRYHAPVETPGGGRPENGYTFSQPDLIIAATAIHSPRPHSRYARDRSDYDKAGVSVINPWDSP